VRNLVALMRKKIFIFLASDFVALAGHATEMRKKFRMTARVGFVACVTLERVLDLGRRVRALSVEA
jgi:hypothetical protein